MMTCFTKIGMSWKDSNPLQLHMFGLDKHQKGVNPLQQHMFSLDESEIFP